MEQITRIFAPSRLGLEVPDKYTTEQEFKEQGYTDMVDIMSILSPEEKQFVSKEGGKLEMMYIQNGESKHLVRMNTILADGVRNMRVPNSFSARTETLSGQRGLVGYPRVAGG